MRVVDLNLRADFPKRKGTIRMSYRLLSVVAVASLGLAGCNSTPPSTASAPPPAARPAPPSVSDLQGARGRTGEAEMQQRGYSVARQRGLTAFWWHPGGACVRTVTGNGRYRTVQNVAAADCGQSPNDTNVAPQVPASRDARVPGTNFNATGQIRCTIGRDASTGSCAFGVVRRGGGTADVTITKPDGSKSVIFFMAGRATGSDASQANRGAFTATKSGDTNIVFVGTERYEIPDAVVNGG